MLFNVEALHQNASAIVSVSVLKKSSILLTIFLFNFAVAQEHLYVVDNPISKCFITRAKTILILTEPGSY